jgi:hypothetical protein
MPRILFAHAVTDADHWASKHSERVAAFAAWGTNVVDYVATDGSGQVIVGVDVHDVDAMQASLSSPEMDAAKRAHGVVEPVILYTASE